MIRMFGYGLIVLATAQILVGCAPVPPKVAPGAATQMGAVASLPVACPHLVVRLTTGLSVDYDGARRTDPDVCVVDWRGARHDYYLGFWGDGRSYDGGAAERQAVRQAVSGKVGTSISYSAHGAQLWSEVTVAHVADATVRIGDQERPAEEMRRVLHDALGREQVRAESLMWVDRATGIMLREQVVTHMADGGRRAETVWQVEDIAAG
jgi:hypothetical protein